LEGLSAEEQELISRTFDNGVDPGAKGAHVERGVIEVTARTWSVRIATMGFVALSLPLPLPTPDVPIALPAVRAVVSALPIATPSLPSVGSHGNSAPATGAAPQAGGTSRPVSSAGTSAARNPKAGFSIPFTAIYVSSPLDIAVVGALAMLPLLFGIWLLVFGRTFNEVRRRRDAQVRLILAADLGLRPKDLTSMSTTALFNLREKSAFDELTGVLRRAAGISAAEREIARARRHNTPMTIAFIDVDGLKETNDTTGHAAGDALLRGLAQVLKEGLRAEDVILRYGGDEFVCVLPETVARGARMKLSDIQAEAARDGVRFCAGIAELKRSDDVVSLFARADRDLYEFKTRRGEIVQLPKKAGRFDPGRSVTASELDNIG
jgi:diguanylate cyclase (GGDEF)-like protein